MLEFLLAMESRPAVGVGMENENVANRHTPDKLLSLLSTTSVYIGNIKTTNNAEAILKESLESDFRTINDLLTNAVTEGVTVDKAEQLQLLESPIRSVNIGYEESIHCSDGCLTLLVV